MAVSGFGVFMPFHPPHAFGTIAVTTSVALLLAAPAQATTGAALQEGDAANRERALQCLTLAIAYEAGGETDSGKLAVGEVILNRTRHPAYPKSVCGVVFQGSSRSTGCQFTFTCDGSLSRTLSGRRMASARATAETVLAGSFTPSVGGATHYHATYVSPYWAPSLIKVGQLGNHIFYRAPGAMDAPTRFVLRSEPVIDALGTLAFAIDPITQGARIALQQAPKAKLATSAAPFMPWGLIVAPPAK
jgi:Cell Wall Hydrolase